MPWFDKNRLNWPLDGDINAWSDYVETLCLFSDGYSFSLEELIDWLTDDPSKKHEHILEAINFNETYLVSGTSTNAKLSAHDDDDSEGDDVENEERELIRSRLLRLFDFLKARQQYLAPYYPFRVTDNQIEQIEKTQLNNGHTIYKILLFSSEMRLFSKTDIPAVGHMFEALCQQPFKQLVPQSAEVKFFGAGGGTIIQSDYQGNLKEKLKSLAVDLCVETKKVVDDPDQLGPSGDAGLDWVAWLPFGDSCNHQPVFFAQCACGSNWADKQHETSLAHWYNLLDLNQSIQCIHFMPRSFRRKSYEWFREKDIFYQLTLIDRFRLLHLLSQAAPNDITDIIKLYQPVLDEALVFEYFD